VTVAFLSQRGCTTVHPRTPGPGTTRRGIALCQGLYYLATGIWPLVHMRSFTAITGPKRDLWLVRTVGLLAAAIALPLLREARRGDSPGTRVLGTAAAAAFAAADVHPVVTGRISAIYLVDAAIEAVFAAAWAGVDDGPVARRVRKSRSHA
jgi:hypothetical protein